MIRKRIYGIVGLMFVVVIAVSFYDRNVQTVQTVQTDSGYIFDANTPITINVKDVDRFKKPSLFPVLAEEDPLIPERKKNTVRGNNQEPSKKPVQIVSFTDSVSFEMLKYFRHLHRYFRKSKNLDEHLEKVLQHLSKLLSPEEAKKLWSLYRNYLECEIELEKEIAQWDQPRTAEEVLEMLARTQEFRRKYLGVDVADALYGAEVKSREYILRRAAITKEKEMYGDEKEQLIEQLNSDMWGDEAEMMEAKPKPYHRYQQKIDLYRNDLAEMGEDEKKETIQTFRRTFFSEEIVAKLEQVDAQIMAEKQAEKDYFAGETQILNSSELSAEEKSEAIHTLQNELFKDEADSFRRRESIRKGLQALKAKGKIAKAE